jgi:hypothetical protein
MVVTSWLETPGSAAATSAALTHTTPRHVTFNSVVATGSGGTTQLRQDHGSEGEDDPFSPRGSDANAIGQRAALFALVRSGVIM